MPINKKLWLSPTVLLPIAAPAVAAPIEGELGSNAAALLVLLGIGALLMGLRNLRELRRKRLIPSRESSTDEGEHDAPR